MVKAYRMVGGEFRSGEFEYMPAPAGGMSTTAGDMALFLLFNLPGNTNLQENTGFSENTGIQENTSPGVKEPLTKPVDPGTHILQDIARMHEPLFTHHPLLGGMAHGFKYYDVNRQRVVFHAGSSTLFDAGFYLLPGKDAGLFICYSGGMYTGHVEVFNSFIQEFFPDRGEPESKDYSEAGAFTGAGDLPGEYQQSRRIETGSGKLLNLFSGMLRIRSNRERELDVDLLVTRSAEDLVRDNDQPGLVIDLLGERYHFDEVEPGIFRNKDAPGFLPGYCLFRAGVGQRLVENSSQDPL